ncbi:uncharacterized protein LOC134281406 [Saccostrea cucullata]|uniref:uncharacterized protein LOC134281406 n=1 Tax=Saccostrea cuccullata TaxID=36930 RepID=UPI002ED5C233
MAQRRRQAPVRYGDWEENFNLRELKDKKLEEKLWEVEDILERKEQEVLVKWKDWEGPSTWVSLDENQELQQFIERNKGNPLSCQLHSRNLDANKVECMDLPDDVMALRQAIFDSLGDARRTPDGALGVQARTTVKVPFSSTSFSTYFRSLKDLDLPADNGNVDFYLTGEEMTCAIGENWSSRCYKTSTETFVSFREYVHVWWGFKERKQYEHNTCKRCNWKDAEENRPELCDPVVLYVRGPSWIHETFTRSRRNMVTGTVAKRRRHKNS